MELNEDWLELCQNGELEELREHYISMYMNLLDGLTSEELRTECISGMNRITRYKTLSCDELGVIVNVGDICFFDYGHAYKNESGFQHLGLVIGVFNYKVCVVPMTSSVKSMVQARNVSKKGKAHLYFIGKVKGLTEPSTLFLNDFKYVNSGRILEIVTNLKPNDKMFIEICDIIKNEMIGCSMVK